MAIDSRWQARRITARILGQRRGDKRILLILQRAGCNLNVGPSSTHHSTIQPKNMQVAVNCTTPGLIPTTNLGESSFPMELFSLASKHIGTVILELNHSGGKVIERRIIFQGPRRWPRTTTRCRRPGCRGGPSMAGIEARITVSFR